MEALIKTPILKKECLTATMSDLSQIVSVSTRDLVGNNEVNKHFANDLPTRANTPNFSSEKKIQM